MSSSPPQSHYCSNSCKHLALAFITIITNATYTTIAPIVPLEMDKHNISEVYVSIVFLAFTFGSLLAPALFATYFESYGRMNIIAYSMVGMSILFWCLGHVFAVVMRKNQYVMVVTSLMFIIQLFLGAFYAMITTGCYSLASLAFVEKESAMSIVESSVGIGHIVGPIIGSVLYDELGYKFLYKVGATSSMMLSAIITRKCFVPIFEDKAPDVCVEDVPSDGKERYACICREEFEKSLRNESSDDAIDEAPDVCVEDVPSDRKERHTCICKGELEKSLLNESGDDANDEEDANCPHSITPKEQELTTGYHLIRSDLHEHELAGQLSSMSLLRFPSILLAALSICWAMVAWAFLEPLFAKYLDNFFNVGNKGIGIIFSLTSIVHVPTTMLVPFIPNSVERRTTITLSLMLTPLSVILIGSDSLELVTLGVSLLGLFPSPVWVQLLPWMQEESQVLFPHPDTKILLNDLTASIYNSFITLGRVLGYGIGSLFGLERFVRTTQLVAVLVFLHSMVFYFGTRKHENR